ncbi:MexE family multidrug efflux RND transporter periplasmic adaptor subunit [Polymorphobacter glacialis]|uniref:MexE family multidrug efflux RND transporter periplasmic adaptor subunit n=1 Tax=Sandarakinorhabdus glacialis TaxID=1614636 RepID=A0A916ZMC0_9SPHN|nr:efflux RND transporter periplasmic adaptor subunit [Polymorphobacter glacialis]GGE03287.1 MexE family multidrug efflux RND transporter periplasmic adaptor subunit [Polymorphobacter glacialis]
MNMTVQSDFSRAIDRARRRPNRVGVAIILGTTALIAIGAAKLAGSAAPAQAALPPPGVTVAVPLVRQVNEWDDYIGRFAPSKSVEIRPRVSGALTGIFFTDGEIVRQGQLLFRIDARPFAAALAEAKARESSALSSVQLAHSALARATRLIADEAVSAEEIDTLRAALRAAEAAVGAARAQVTARALDVEFTEVRSPITGRISDRRADIGNLVAGGEANSATLLTTVYALDPIYFSFDGSEALYLKAHRGGDATNDRVEIQLQDETGYRWKGRVDFSDNRIDPGAGTIRGRAIIANPGYFLTPGMFGNMRLASGPTRSALLVPDSAIGTDQARKTVQVVGADNIVAIHPVVLGPVIEGLRIVRSGLKPTDRVIVQGMQNAIPGAPVTPKTTTAAASADDTMTLDSTAPIAAQATFAAAR